MADLPVTTLVGIAAFAVGGLFGWTAHRTNFCTMGGISDGVLMGDWRRFRAWMLATAVAVLGTQGMALSGQIDLAKSIYLGPNLGWAGAILGGLMFGYGMTLTGGCGNKTLVRLGAGNLKSLVVFLVIAVFAYATQRGILALGRVQLETLNLNLSTLGLRGQGLPEMLAATTGMAPKSARLALALLLGGGLAVWALSCRDFRTSSADLTAGMVVGALVVAGWAATGILGRDEFEPTPLASLTFVAPMGNALQYVMSFTGATIDFGIAAVGGVVTGAFVSSRLAGNFAWEGFADTADMRRHLGGAAIMGIGGVLALGCTVGQGITGVSTLGLSSVLALLSLLAGGFIGIRALEEGGVIPAMAAIMGAFRRGGA